MRILFWIAMIGLLSSVSGVGQGHFLFFNGTARTRLESIDGPLAGRGIWAQMLAGPTPSSLMPVGIPLEHTTNGAVGGIIHVIVPSIPPHNVAYVQMVAWDGTRWGTSLDGVPANQLGRTDIVPVFLTTGIFPDSTSAPRFTQPAVVPPIPEPSVVVLLIFGGVNLFLVGRFRRRRLQITDS